MTPLVSASQISKWRECPRKWAFQHISGLFQPQGEAAQLGDEVDAGQLQPFLTRGRAFDYTLPTRPGFLQSGYIAASALPHLPPPMSHGLECQKHFAIPSPTGVVDGKAKFGFQGYLDFWLPYYNVGAPLVGDFKTSKTLNYAKDSEDLLVDPQALLYAMWALVSTGAREVDLRWIYMRTTGSTKSKLTEVRVGCDHVAEQFAELDATAVQIVEAKASCKDPLALPPNADSCEAFGGCPFRDKCNLSPEEKTKSLAAKWRRNLPVLNVPNADEVPNMSLDALKARLAAKKSPVMGMSDRDVPAPPENIVPPAFAAPVDTGPINPPEAALPPAPAVGVVSNPPAGTLSEPVRAKRGPKPKVVIETPAPCPVEYPVLEETFEVTWGEECFQPVQYNTFRVGPFKATGTVRQGETLSDAMRRVSSELASFASDERQIKGDGFKRALGKVMA